MRIGANTVFAATLFALVLLSASLVGAVSMWTKGVGFEVSASTGDPGLKVVEAGGYVVLTTCCPCCGEVCHSTEIADIPMSDVWVTDDGGSAGARVYLLTHKPVVWVGAIMRSNGTVPVTLTGFDVYASASHGLGTSVDVFVYGPYSNASGSSAWGVGGCSLPPDNQSGLPMKLWPGEEAIVWVEVELTHHHHCGDDAVSGSGEIGPDCGCPSPIRVDVSITPVTQGSE